MKKTIMVLSASALFAISCKKTETIHSAVKKDLALAIPNASCMKNKVSFDHLFDNAQDEEERQIDMKHYQLIKSILPLANKKEFKDLLAKSKTSNNNCIETNEILALQMGNVTPANNNDCSVTHSGLLYHSVIFIANAATADFSLSPIFSPGIELYDDETEGAEVNHDVIFAWYVNENNDTFEVNLGDLDYKKTKRPILVAALELCEGQTEKVEKIAVRNMERRSAFSPVIDGLKVNFRYDNTKYSEVYISAIHTTTNSVINGFNGKLRDVHKNDIGVFKSLGFDWKFGFITVNNPANERICYNAYEYDWYAPERDLGWCYLKGSTSGAKYNLRRGRRRFDNEWYSFPVGDLSSYEIPLANLGTNSTLFSWNKGSATIKK